jgi:hypothetical protein
LVTDNKLSKFMLFASLMNNTIVSKLIKI